ncbi:O-antigen polymerase [Yoonia sp. SS1-5]|uniref:O-antigen polymerase n=1 Tax=Yoonia rhodophyticola TaxID=3137370 RepID=A0AAN0MK30_9RHOB
MDAFLILLLAAIATGLPLYLGQKYGLVRLVSPLHLVGIFCFLGFGLKSAVYVVAPDLAFHARFVDTPWGSQLGALYLTLFVLVICLGYRCACSPVSRSDNVVAARLVAAGVVRRGWLFAVALGVSVVTMGIILQARGGSWLSLDVLTALNQDRQINVNADGIGAMMAGIKSFFLVPECAFVLLLGHGIVTGARRSLWQAAILAGLLVCIALISADRFDLIELVVFGVATHMILGGRLHLRLMVVCAVGIAALCIVSAYMTQLRFGIDRALVWQMLGRQIVGSTYFLDINAAVMVTDRVEAQHLMLGQSYLWWSFGWVPRAFWPDKPAIDLGVFFKREIMQVYSGGSYNVTGPGEAFINFSWLGVAVGFALGWIYRWGEAALLSAFGAIRYGAFAAYPLIFYPFVQASLQSSFSAFVVGAAAQLVLLAVLIWVFLRRYRFWISPQSRERNSLYVA